MKSLQFTIENTGRVSRCCRKCITLCTALIERKCITYFSLSLFVTAHASNDRTEMQLFHMAFVFLIRPSERAPQMVNWFYLHEKKKNERFENSFNANSNASYILLFISPSVCLRILFLSSLLIISKCPARNNEINRRKNDKRPFDVVVLIVLICTDRLLKRDTTIWRHSLAFAYSFILRTWLTDYCLWKSVRDSIRWINLAWATYVCVCVSWCLLSKTTLFQFTSCKKWRYEFQLFCLHWHYAHVNFRIIVNLIWL